MTELVIDKEYTLLKHNFGKGGEVKEHFHPYADEWIIVDNGCATLSDDFNVLKEKQFSEHSTGIIHYPRGTIHGMKFHETTEYLVMRKGRAGTLYLDDLMSDRLLHHQKSYYNLNHHIYMLM